MVADQHVREREQPDRQCVRCEHPSSLGEVRPERHRDEPDTGGRVEERERPAEEGRRQERTPEDVLGLLAAGLARGRAREEDREDRGRQEEPDACERRSSRVGAGVVGREARLDDQDVHVGEECDPDEPDDDRSEVAEKRTELGSRARRAAPQWLADDGHRECGARDRPGNGREDRASEAVAGRGGHGEDRDTQGERRDVHHGQGVEPLLSLEHADRHREDQRRQEGGLGEHHRGGGVDVEHVGEWNGERQGNGDERYGPNERAP